MKTALSTILMLFSCCLFGQLEWNVCPENTYCLNGVYETSFSFPASNVVEPPIELCDESLSAGQISMRFEAVSSYLEVLAGYGGPGDDYASVGIKESCEDGCIVWQTCGQNGVDFETNALVPGREYIFYFSGCNEHLGFSVHILRLTEGPDETNFSIESVELAYQEECSFGGSDFCCSENLFLRIETEDPEWNELLQYKKGTWRLDVEGEVNTTLEAEDLFSFDFCSLPYGDYVLTLKEFEYACGIIEYDLSYEFSILDLTEDFGEGLACQHELESNYWKPDGWKGEALTEPGEHHHRYYNDCNCPIDQYVNIDQFDEVYEQHELVLCPDDYPYEFFDGYELDYEQWDYDIMLRFNGESMVEDIDGSDCDSLIHLYVINEKPEERCSSCELPVSLEKSKIIYCVPFDNGTYDVSGKANRIYPVGVGYDNNGPASNPLWEAEFDGRNDYVWIPHMDDLNTSVFALDIEFRKEGEFENGEPEVLVSKGDLTEGNRRFDITLEEQTANSFVLNANCYTESEIISIEVPDLMIGEWYGTTLVVEEDSISLYMNGTLFETKMKTGDLRGNDLNMYLATEEDGGELTNFFDGRMDDFKYWKQKLSGQDVLYLYFPEKEFEVNIDVFLRCCESAEIFDFIIDQNNPNDTLIIGEASPTGYDSVYYVNMIPIETGPGIDSLFIPGDIVINKTIACNETCSQLVEWTEPSMSAFNDICGIAMIESSHSSPMLLDESISYVEIEYTATNVCGQKSSYSFSLELQCEAEDFTLLPQGNDFVIGNSMSCEDGELFCKGGDMRLKVFSHDTTQIDPMLYGSLRYRLRINGVDLEVWVDEEDDFEVELDIDVLGLHEICYVSLSSECEEVEVNVCKQIEVIEGFEIDHGTVIACQGSVEEVLPDNMGQELLNYLLVSGEGGLVESITEDDCSCRSTERIRVIYQEEKTAEHIYDVCEGELPIEILGEEFDGETVYDRTELVFVAMSRQMDSNGNNCDSTIVLTINVLEEKQTEFNVEICDGEDYNGYSIPGTYTENYQTEAGCDSIVTVNVIVSEGVEEQINAVICEGEDIFGYTTSGSYVDILIAENGCDSVRYLDLLVHENIVEELEIEICPDEEYNGYTESGLYEENYFSSMGCDSTIFIQLTVLEEGHEDCFVSSVRESLINEIEIFPNPVYDRFYFKLELSILQKYQIELYDISGKKHNLNWEGNSVNMIDISAGVYLLNIRSGKDQKVIKLIKS